MIAIWVTLACSVLVGAYALIDAGYQPTSMSVSGYVLAQHMSVYRDAVTHYALDHPAFEGSVPDVSLRPLLAQQTIDPLWRNYVVPNTDAPGSIVVIYSTSVAAAPAVPAIERLAGGSALAGVTFNGTVVSRGNPAVPLPAALASAVPNGMPVWIAQAWLP